MARELFAHQVRALDYAHQRRRIALFMDMRLGKSLTAIRWADPLGGDILVVGPLSVLPGWIDELQKEGITRVKPIYGLSSATRHAILLTHRTSQEPTWFFVNYEAIRANPMILAGPWRTLILDESTRIRNPKAQITKLLLRETGWVTNRAILSGLPAPESSADYFCQMKFLYGSFMGTSNYWAFRNRFYHRVLYDWIPNPGTVEAIKRAVHETSFVLTRHQAGMGSRKLYETRVVQMTPSQRAFTKQVMDDFAFGPTMETQWAPVKMVWLARLAGGFSPDRDNPTQISDTKTRELLSLLTGELKGQPVVVWFRFNEELNAVFSMLTDHGVECMGITGATPVKDRRSIAQLFQGGGFPVLLMQAKVGQFGLDLSAASTAIYYSNVYEYEARAQSEDRIVHPMKKDPLLYIDLVTRGSVDRAVVAALQDKSLTAKTFMRRLVTDWAEEWRAAHGKGARPIYTVSAAAPTAATRPLRARIRRVFPG